MLSFTKIITFKEAKTSTKTVIAISWPGRFDVTNWEFRIFLWVPDIIQFAVLLQRAVLSFLELIFLLDLIIRIATLISSVQTIAQKWNFEWNDNNIIWKQNST